jgi:transcriptional regulator with XRE-family HTH domain
MVEPSTIAPVSLPQRIFEARTHRLELTQRELANRLEIEPVNISRWETGKAVPRLTHLRALARMSGVSVAWFYENEETAA